VDSIQILALVLGTGFASGINLYATVATLGLLELYGILHLSGPLNELSRPWVIGVALALYVVEFFADKIPYFDNLWDTIHTFIRPPAAALLAYSVAGNVPADWRWIAALLAGGVALTSHGAKASTRVAVNTLPEPFSNWALSTGEDLLAVWLTWFATKHPSATIALVAALVALCVYLIVRLFRFARRVFA
jgi:Domain of unknown function (DUF4126)